VLTWIPGARLTDGPLKYGQVIAAALTVHGRLALDIKIAPAENKNPMQKYSDEPTWLAEPTSLLALAPPGDRVISKKIFVRRPDSTIRAPT